MKKFLSGFIAGILIASLFSVFAQNAIKKAYFNDNITIKVNGVKQDVQALSVILEGSDNALTYLPLRKTAELVGKDINWDADTNTADIVEKSYKLSTSSIEANSYKQDGYICYMVDGEEYYTIKSIEDKINKNGEYYRFGFDKETQTYYFVYNQDTFNKSTKYQILLSNINYKLINGQSCILKDFYLNNIYPLTIKQ